MLIDNEIQYFWLDFNAGEDYPDYSGSVSCKIQTNVPEATSV